MNSAVFKSKEAANDFRRHMEDWDRAYGLSTHWTPGDSHAVSVLQSDAEWDAIQTANITAVNAIKVINDGPAQLTEARGAINALWDCIYGDDDYARRSAEYGEKLGGTRPWTNSLSEDRAEWRCFVSTRMHRIWAAHCALTDFAPVPEKVQRKRGTKGGRRHGRSKVPSSS